MKENDSGEEIVLARAEPFERLGAAITLLGQVTDADAAGADDGDLSRVHKGIPRNAHCEEDNCPGDAEPRDEGTLVEEQCQ